MEINKKKLKVGLQLFGIREAMAEDMEAALKTVKLFIFSLLYILAYRHIAIYAGK